MLAAMTRPALLGIGSFAMLTRHLRARLRHYDETGVLAPARVDPATGYRFYRPDQVGAGRLVRELHALDLPLDEVRRLLDGADRDEVRSILVHHRERLTERAAVLSRQLAALERSIERGVTVSPRRRPHARQRDVRRVEHAGMVPPQRQPRRPLPGLMRGPQ